MYAEKLRLKRRRAAALQSERLAMSAYRHRPRVYVIAGINGAGKSSIAGEAFRQSGTDYYTPMKPRDGS